MILILLLTMPSFAAVVPVCPDRCTCTVKDSVACEDKAVVDIATFNIPHNFTYVRVSGTQATELNEHSFQQMPFTLRLFLQSNRFSIITPGAFQKFPLLKTLRLSKNNVSSLSSGVFSTLVYLEHLFLDENALVYLDPSIFNDLSKLKILNLSINRLQALPKYIFRSLSNLTQLYLNVNLLVEIPYWMFEDLTALVELHLQSNLIETIDREAFYRLPKLNQLLLQKNRLKTLTNGLFFYLQKLQVLHLYENPLIELPNVLFGKIDSLRSLSLWGTSLSTIPNFIFSNLTNLEVLVLTRNTKLHFLPKDTFRGLTKLVKLYLYNNNLSSLPAGLFQDLQSLQILSMYNNTFGDLPDDLLKPLINLQYIDLNNSKITTLPENFFTMLPKLQSVHLWGNPWMCDCKLKGFKSWLERNTAKVPNHMSLLCTNPPMLKAIPVLALEAQICSPTTREKSGSYITTPSSSLNSFGTSGKIISTPTTEGTSVYTFKWYRSKTIKHCKTNTKRTSSGFKMLHACHLPYSKIFYFLHYFVTSMQISFTLIQCFVLVQIRTFYRHFTFPSDPVVLVHMIVPPNCDFSDPDK